MLYNNYKIMHLLFKFRKYKTTHKINKHLGTYCISLHGIVANH